jgi:hypothetical protein
VADIMVNTQRPAEAGEKEWSFALIVQDIFSRFAWAELIDSPMHADEGLRKILARAHGPDDLLTDEDPGFKTPEFEDLLKEHDIVQEFRAGRNDMATVDRLIFALKRAMAEHEADTGEGWAARLQEAVRGHNEVGTGHLYGSAPEDVMGRKCANLELNLEWDESHAMRDNARQIEKRAATLQERGAYRVYQPVKGLRRRAHQPIWGRELHRLGDGDVKGAFVGPYPTKEVLAVPRDSTALAPEKVPLNYRARHILWRYAARVAGFVGSSDDQTATSARVANVMLEVAGSRANLINAFRLAGVSTRELVASLARIYPDYLKVEGGKVTFVG